MVPVRTPVRLLALLLAVAAAAAGATVAAGPADVVGPRADASAAGGATTVTGCTLITQPGRYVLANDVVDTEANRCINIQASDVYFDGAGHTIDGVGRDLFTTNEGVETATKGILAKNGPHTNVTVANVVVTGFGYGLWYGETSNGCIMHNTFRDNGIYGLYVGYGADDNLIVDNVVSDIRSPDPDLYGQGIVVANAAHGSHIEGNEVRGIEQFGIEIATSNHTTIVNNTVADTGSHGITVSNEGNVIRGNTVSRSAEAGINARRSPGVEIAANVVEDSRDGVALAFSDGAVLRDNVVRGNDRYGLRFHGGFAEPWGDHASPGSTVVGNTVADNGEVGVFLARNNNHTRLEANEIRRNGEAGVRLERNGDNRLVGNVLGDQPIGVVLSEIDGVTLADNAFENHAEWALLGRHQASPVEVDGWALGDGTTAAIRSRNVAVRRDAGGPGGLPDGARPLGSFVELWPEAGDGAWAELTLDHEAASDGAGPVAVWVYDGSWRRAATAEEADGLTTNVTGIDGTVFVGLAAGPAPTPSPTADTAVEPAPEPTAEPTPEPTPTPGQPGFGVVVALLGLAAGLLARRSRR